MRARPKNLPPSSSRSSNRDESGRERADGGRSHLQVATLYSSRHGGQDRASCQANSRVASAWLVQISSTLRVILCPGDAAVRSKSLPVPGTQVGLATRSSSISRIDPVRNRFEAPVPRSSSSGGTAGGRGVATHRNSGRIHHVAIRILAFRAARAAEHSQTTPFSRWSAR
jgi:hypothetical protein